MNDQQKLLPVQRFTFVQDASPPTTADGDRRDAARWRYFKALSAVEADNAELECRVDAAIALQSSKEGV